MRYIFKKGILCHLQNVNVNLESTWRTVLKKYSFIISFIYLIIWVSSNLINAIFFIHLYLYLYFELFCYTQKYFDISQINLQIKNTNICNTETLYIEIQIHTFISIVSNRTTFTHFHLSHRSQPFFNWITCINGMVYLHLRRDFVHLDTQDINRCICVYVCVCALYPLDAYIHIYCFEDTFTKH